MISQVKTEQQKMINLQPNSRLNAEKENTINLFHELTENSNEGILILTNKKESIYKNQQAQIIFSQLNKGKKTDDIPQEIWHICQSLIESGCLFPNQHWMIESQIFTGELVAIRIRVRWLKLDEIEHPCILVTIEDVYQPIQNIAIAEAEKYRLTPREKDVWLLYRANYTYKQIAAELCITLNTVKKHMKSIYSKQTEILEQET